MNQEQLMPPQLENMDCYKTVSHETLLEKQRFIMKKFDDCINILNVEIKWLTRLCNFICRVMLKIGQI